MKEGIRKLGAVSFVIAVALSGAATEPGFVDLFDGKTLDGWEVRGGDAFYVVSNGCIRGRVRVPLLARGGVHPRGDPAGGRGVARAIE